MGAGRQVQRDLMTLKGVIESPEKWSLSFWDDGIADFRLVGLVAQ